MLVLKLSRGDRVYIGDTQVVVTLVECRNNSVRLGFEAPKELPIEREAVRRRRLGDEKKAS